MKGIDAKKIAQDELERLRHGETHEQVMQKISNGEVASWWAYLYGYHMARSEA